MSLKIGIWRIKERALEIQSSEIDYEERLEALIEADSNLLGEEILIIGRQVATVFGGRVDLLAIDPSGNLVVIEVKKGRTPRDVVAQSIDYASWVKQLDEVQIASIYKDFLTRFHPETIEQSLDQAFIKVFGSKIPEELNSEVRILIVAAAIDDSTERIVNYLSNEYGINVNVALFQFFKDNGSEYLTRAWLIEPETIAAKEAMKEAQAGEWNGEFYASFGHGSSRSWDDARKIGFISASGGLWYTKTLEMLKPGDRVWVNVPGEGYVGVGIVTSAAVSGDAFRDASGNHLKDLKLSAANMIDATIEKDKQAILVGVKWLKTVPLHEAVKEKGFFGNQNSVAKPVSPKWAHTVSRLKAIFEIRDSEEKAA